MDTETNTKRIAPTLLFAGLVLIFAIIAIATVFAVQYRNEHRSTVELEGVEADLQGLGVQIASLKDADLKSMNDYIAAYAQIEPLEQTYDQKLERFVELYNAARESDSHRGFLDIRNFEGRHHPKTWENMSEIIALVRQINDITKREGAVIHAMASLPETERVRFWHEQFMPLVAEEHALRQKLQRAGQRTSPESNESSPHNNFDFASPLACAERRSGAT